MLLKLDLLAIAAAQVHPVVIVWKYELRVKVSQADTNVINHYKACLTKALNKVYLAKRKQIFNGRKIGAG